MKVKDIMTKEVVTVKEEDTVEIAANVLNDNSLSGLPVVDENKLLKGIITEGDLMRRVSRIDGPSYIEILGGIFALESKSKLAERLQKSMGYLVKDMMTEDVITIFEDATIEDAATLMVKEKVKRIPVVDEVGILIGIISRRDIMHHLFDKD